MQGGFAMRQVYISQDGTQVGYYKSILDEAGIRSFIRNENGSFTGTSGPLFFPALCVIDDDDFDEAVRLLKARQAEPVHFGPEWKCASCSEMNPANFELCWNCNTARPGI